MSATLTITLPPRMKADLDKMARKTHLRKGDLVRGAIGRLVARQQFQAIREELAAEAQQKGIYTDEDIFKMVS
ncbi:MAG: hypothetical protein A2268_06830 [Candidatus Raymondbacteria bacterium RifOxyA12_full_50_37]|uniref:Ribbon-helix-helix protein CopG domain-containing protein n=1 Tax=Candidatus Raymondbacteria bacterium RIFOXYD12_FULL_49_13 TaxID=1817890 RepID=A0A1F7FL56_UNCRA|nr:MAG: hypothetical protein A2268_06830 [Candidatus Raymondbacteria bacterium RifOxyA12_full_50_37]OGJ88808.1 MAG: hypothetical protein A2248_08410 [Candidatus Raymondbacteria bacterium RIFOXYA2_FULL_49_16]OGJ96567.1 MAG: hypothetical protein A2453_03375 [Candidatus Raymondbacteria bacterium RIFOXYC2_FULL_50_21]OGJ99662.1 MAG: hypothetical protein A2487_17270 [Candidatus Raymondbacteria bacterium RifOxyC12_full_50_8]OGK04428.1 MAG: hypothetical protein A2350_17040 [Candidatus Raymondbacteria b